MLEVEYPNTIHGSCSHIGFVFKKQGQYHEAEAMNRGSLEVTERILDLDHPDTFRSVRNLRSVLERQEKYGEAEVLYHRDIARTKEC